MPTYEGLRLKVLKFRREKFAAKRKQNLIDTKFTIISNNCWGGMLYESYDLPKESPTVGLFIMADDYIKFLKDLKEYLDSELTFIDPKASKWYSQVSVDKRYGNYPVGKLKDVEIFFLHYHSEEEVMAKWHRRIKRINWDRLLVKFNDLNGCTRKDVVDLVTRLSLTSDNLWVEHMIKEKQCISRSLKYANKVRESGYDIQNIATYLQNFYLKNI
ncbi:DUF1919 domain-containing protein [Lactobacillus sp.]|uniref:DUF1919 domain-containing protein n=1 Tax=Lactobacillus sp. TaxID=1591 RepID=UPI003F02CAB7